MSGMSLAGRAIFLDLKAIRIVLLIFAGNIVSVLALGASQCYTVSLSLSSHFLHLQNAYRNTTRK